MNHTIKFDLMGQRKVVFTETHVAYMAEEIYPVPLPIGFYTVSLRVNKPVCIDQIEWVGIIRKRQLWCLIAVVLCAPLGGFWLYDNYGNWGPFAFSAVFTLLFAVIPMWLYVSGRKHLLITTGTEGFAIPADRKKKQVRKVVEILKKHVPASSFHL